MNDHETEPISNLCQDDTFVLNPFSEFCNTSTSSEEDKPSILKLANEPNVNNDFLAGYRWKDSLLGAF